MWQSYLDQKRRESRSHAFERRLCGIAVGLILPGQWGGLVLVRRMRQPSQVTKCEDRNGVVRCACNDRKYLVMPRFVHLQYRRMKFRKLSDFHGGLARIRASRKLYPAYLPCSRDAAHIRRGRSGVAEQELHGSQIPRAAVDQRCACHPGGKEASILAGCHRPIAPTAPSEQILAWPAKSRAILTP